MKDPNNKKKWIVDTEAAEVVKSIFAMCIEGKGNETIARILQENKVLIPMAYWQSKGLNKGGKKTQPDPYKWCKTTVQKILAQQEYCGDVINFKTYSKNFKNKTRLNNPVENWKIFKNVVESESAAKHHRLVLCLLVGLGQKHCAVGFNFRHGFEKSFLKFIYSFGFFYILCVKITHTDTSR